MTWGSFNGDEAEAHAQLDKYWELGANFIDTAEMYPVAFNYGATTEKWIGTWLTSRKIDRSKVYIATKVNINGIGSGGESHSFEAEKVLKSCELSLERLQTDYIDLYQLHYPSRQGGALFGWGNYGSPERYAKSKTSGGGLEVFERQVLAIKQLFDKGLIKDWGLSNENAYGTTMFCLACDKLGVPRPVSIQNDFSLNNRVYEGDVAEAAHEFGLVGLPYGALGGGVLTGKYGNPKYAGDRPLDLARMNARPEFQGRYNNPSAKRAANEYAKLAEAWGLKPVELAYAWARDRWYNGAVITGTTTVQQVEDAVSAFKLDTLPADLLKAVDDLHEKFRSPSAALTDQSVLLTMDAFKAEDNINDDDATTCGTP